MRKNKLIALIFDKVISYTVGNYIDKALRGTGMRFEYFSLKDASKICSAFDLYLRIDHGDYKYDLPSHLKPSAFWLLDAHLKKPYKKIRKQARHYDFIFCSNKRETEKLNRIGISSVWIPFACDPEIHKKLDVEKKYDLGYVGGDGGILRKFILQELRERKPNSFIGSAPYKQMGEIYSSAKIGFNYSNYLGSGNKIVGILSMRFFEVMSCGAMLLTNDVDDGSIEHLGFEDRKHLVIYRNYDEMFELIDYYLTHDDERENIAQRGHRLVMGEHTYAHRLKVRFEYMGYEL